MALGTSFPMLLVAAGTMSANLSGASIPVPSTAANVIVSGFSSGPRGALANPATASAAKVGVAAPAYDLIIFERIHVLPRTSDIGVLISEQAITVEVWNAFRDASKSLTAITVAGSAGLVVDNPGGVPSHYPPFESKVYTVRALTSGDSNINNVVTWTFTGIPTTGTTLSVTGARMVPWPFPWNPGAGELLELYGAETSVWESGDGTEQRRQLVGGARAMSLEYGVTLSDERDAAHANALLYGWQAQPYGVPHWQHSTRLATQVAADATTILLDTTGVPYEVGAQVFLWRDPYTWEALTIQAVAAGSLTTTTGARSTWPAGASVVMPISIGRLSPEESFDWRDLRVGQARLAFSLERTARPAAPTGFTQYLGLDVLDQRQHNRTGVVTEQLRRRFGILDSGTGKRQSDVPTAAPAPVRPFIWTCTSRTQAAVLRSFLDARKGRAVPFWLPSYQQDLTLASDASSGATSLSVRRIAYTQQMFPAGGGRRHVAIYPHGGGALTLRKVTGATDPGDGLTESLAVAALPQAYPAASTIVSFLKLCRLEDDAVEIGWLANGAAGAVIRVRELPMEAPV